MKKIIVLFLLVANHQALFSQVNLNQGLQLYFNFNGNANDVSGNGNHGTVNGAQLVTDKWGNSNGAYRFDGG